MAACKTTNPQVLKPLSPETPESCGQVKPPMGFALPLGFLTGTNPELILVRRTKEPKICGSHLSP